jgi:hypothetical protein
MADKAEVIVSVDKELYAVIKWLYDYKNIADEVLTTVSMDESQSPHLRDLALRALNIAAFEDPTK